MSRLRCPSCHGSALADDEFCEHCGAPVGRQRNEVRRHVEIDVERAAAVSDVGLVRTRNEDAAYLLADKRQLVAVVCDGVSSSAGSQVAAEVAAVTAGRALGVRSDVTAGPAARMAAALHAAGEQVTALPWDDDARSDPPSCTTVAALVEDATVTIGWAGDSRAYWVAGDAVRRLTDDHSWAHDQVASGAMTAAQALADRRAHAITRWLGADQPADEPAVITFVPTDAGHLLLCTDGLWNEIESEADLLAAFGNRCRRPMDIATSLTRAALAGGGRDNVTVAVIAVEPVTDGAAR